MQSLVINPLSYCFSCISESLFKQALEKDDALKMNMESALLQMQLSSVENLYTKVV